MGLMAPIVTTGVSIVGKKNLSHASSLCWGTTFIFLYRSTEDPRIVRVILAPKPCNFRCIEKKRSHANLSTNTYISRIMRVSLAQGAMQILYKSLTRHPNRGHAALLLEKNSMYVSMQNFLCAKKKCN